MSESQSTEPWVAPIQALINRGVAQSESAASMCRELDGRSLQIVVESTPLKACVEVADGRVVISPGVSEGPDATISGLPFSLLRMTAADAEGAIRRGDVKITGNPVIADDFRALFQLTRPDWEEELSRYTGDVIAHEIGLGARILQNWAERVRAMLARSAGEYLTEEAQIVVTGTELEEFCADVDELAADVDRAEAALRLLREEYAADDEFEDDPESGA